MSDPKSKPTWIRHKPGCGQRIFNDPIDISAHKQYCPADHDHRLGQIDKALDRALIRIDELEAAAIAPAPEPILNDEVADWTVDDEQQSQYLDDITPPATADNPTASEADEDGYFAPAIDRDDIPYVR